MYRKTFLLIVLTIIASVTAAAQAQDVQERWATMNARRAEFTRQSAARRAGYAQQLSARRAGYWGYAKDVTPPASDIDEAIARVHEEIRDITGDGQVNCQDYAAMFLRHYPTAQIIYNPEIGPTGHVFNRVNGLDIEPQVINGRWRMEQVRPGYLGLSKYNSERTEIYRK
jgi:hypothetical protein